MPKIRGSVTAGPGVIITNTITIVGVEFLCKILGRPVVLKWRYLSF